MIVHGSSCTPGIVGSKQWLVSVFNQIDFHQEHRLVRASCSWELNIYSLSRETAGFGDMEIRWIYEGHAYPPFSLPLPLQSCFISSYTGVWTFLWLIGPKLLPSKLYMIFQLGKVSVQHGKELLRQPQGQMLLSERYLFVTSRRSEANTLGIAAYPLLSLAAFRYWEIGELCQLLSIKFPKPVANHAN